MHACRFKLCPRREQVIKGLGVKNNAAVASTSQRDAVYCSDNCRNQHVQASAAAAAAARGHASPAAGRGHDDVAETPEGQQGPRDHASLHQNERPKGSSTAKGRGRKAGRNTSSPRPLTAVEPRAAQGRPGRKAAVRAACSACGGKVCRIRMCRRSAAASLCMRVPRFFCRACAAWLHRACVLHRCTCVRASCTPAAPLHVDVLVLIAAAVRCCSRREQVTSGLGVQNTADKATTSQRDAVYCTTACKNLHVKESAAAARPAGSRAAGKEVTQPPHGAHRRAARTHDSPYAADAAPSSFEQGRRSSPQTPQTPASGVKLFSSPIGPDRRGADAVPSPEPTPYTATPAARSKQKNARTPQASKDNEGGPEKEPDKQLASAGPQANDEDGGLTQTPGAASAHKPRHAPPTWDFGATLLPR